VSEPLDVEITLIRQSGLFLSAWYLAQHLDAQRRGEDGIAHFCTAGCAAGAWPNPYFDSHWYLARNPEVAAQKINPLVHYIVFGDFEGRAPCPFFDVGWYRMEYRLRDQELCLRHFLERRLTGQVNPVPMFDAAYYLDNNADVAASGADPFEHFLRFGAAELRAPAAEFDIIFYTSRYRSALGGDNPLLHYLANRESGVFVPARPAHEKLVPGAIRDATRPSALFEDVQPVPEHATRRAMLLAYYLPQFHQVPENDAWWGKGFTDWTNLGRAMPRFAGHLQPRIPRDLGFYSLDDPATLRRQIELARGAGLTGFVFYTYWFNRHRLLQKPLEQLLGDATLDIKFCVMWANENWTRRWDGLEREVLIAQEYLESDDAALIACFARMFADPRYIRIEGRPLLMIYRITLVPNARTRIARWRNMFFELHGENPLLVMAQSLGDYDPEPFGLDGAVEFPPHKLSQETLRINIGLDLFDPDFSATVHDYEDIANTSLALPVPDYPLIKTIVPGWDNDPRREGKGLVLHDATPARYQAWLEKLIDYTEENRFFGARIICVNAWNEWAEGAFLEPDVHYGAAHLNATGRAVCAGAASAAERGILLVGHDAQRHGGQLLLLHIARRLKRQWGMQVHLLLLGVGPLLGAYHETAEVTVAYDKTIIGNLLDKYSAAGLRSAIVNSAAAARIVPWLTQRGIAATLLIHEMPQLLQEYNLEIQARSGAAAAAHLVFASRIVAEKFCAATRLELRDAIILPQGNYQNMRFDTEARKKIRAALGLAAEDFLVLGAGYAHIRKGFDLFLQLSRKCAARRGDVHFAWVGDIEFLLKTYLGPELAQAQAGGKFHHIAFTEDVAAYFAAADVLALTSREDPYPTVVLEALACGVPCVAFEESGGIPELLRREDAGRIARMGDVDDFLAEVEALLDHARLEDIRPTLAAMAAAKFDFGAYTEALLRLTQPALQTVSVAVINYNYAHYLPGRLSSIFAQSYPVREILFLDDASTDGSREVASAAAAAAGRDIRLLMNPQNSGSAFAQWRRAAALARGDYIWLCEADDEAAPEFLSRLLAAMAAAKNPVLGFADSRAIDAAGATVMSSYQAYYFKSGAPELAAPGQWEARQFAEKFLALRNLIPNVSAVLWRRDALLAALDTLPDLESWRLAGDWRLYLAALTSCPGEVVYVAAPLNVHRRHDGGITANLPAAVHLGEIAKIHEIMGETLGLDAQTRAAQAAYRAEIADQLGLAPRLLAPTLSTI
jgi:glycosyltransferase involved in cell wall biosynthesis